MNTYLLLRNNKETGPYSLDQLVKLGLKKYDLVWAEGKSAAWRYPGEVDELKPYAPPLDELPFSEPAKRQKAQATSNICNTDTYTQQKVAMAARPKPRIRVKAEWSKVEAPAAVAAAVAETVAYSQPVIEQKAPAQPAPAEKPSWETSWLNWQEEQSTAKQVAQNKPVTVKAEESVRNVSATNNTTGTTATAAERLKKAAAETPVLETKFSQSLNDIKERYAATVLKAKTNAAGFTKYKSLAIIAMLAIPVMCFGIWLGSKWTAKGNAGQVVYAKTTPATQPGATQPNDDAAVQDNAANTQAAVKNNSKEVIPDFNDNTPAAKPVAKRKTIKLPATTPLKKQPVLAAKKPNLAERAKYLIAPPTAAAAGQRVKTVNKALDNLQNALHLPKHPALPVPPQAQTQVQENNSKPAFPHSVRNESIDDYVAVEADKPYTQTVQDVKLNVQNVADVPLDLVVIDVEYFDAGNRFKNGQTIRIKNIPAGETVNVNVPDNPNAAKLRYRLALVSADKKNVYIVGE